jgi:PAS domain S-box-containing protein
MSDRRFIAKHRRILMLKRIFKLLVRSIVVSWIAFVVTFGFLAGANANAANYDPYAFATGIAALFGVACGIIALLSVRNRMLRADLRRAEEHIEALSDRNWQLRESEERAKSFLEAQGDLIVRRDLSGWIIYVNDAFCALAGKPRDALLGTAYILRVIEQGEIKMSPDGTRIHDQMVETIEGPRSIAWREVTMRGDDEERSEVQSVGRDITDRARTERVLADARDQADSANRAKGRFLTMVSHEIRTPLNGILGMTDLLHDTPLSPEQTAYVAAVRTSGDTLLSLIDEVLDFSKIEAGKLDLDSRPFVLTALVEETVELLGPRAQAKGIEIAAYVDDGLPPVVLGDSSRLRQVLLNLAGNAIKFTERGGVSVIVEPGIWPGELTFIVRDTGIGIAHDALYRIFAEFEQADGGAARKFSGTGLGLAISKRIVERMDGRIDVESMPGVGSTFSFTVALPTSKMEGTPDFLAPRLAGFGILIVAPNPVESSLIARRLMRWGAYACVVTDEKAALAALRERPWNTVIVDHALGGEAAEDIGRACKPETTRRIVLVKPGDRRALAAMKAAGFTSYLIQPVRTASLAARFAPGGDVFERINDAELPGETPPLRLAIDDGHEFHGLSILVAEDNDINALLARALLVKLGHYPTIATTGTEAINLWLKARASGHPYDLVLMDVQMPGCDGIEATCRIRAAEAEHASPRTPIIALTANAFVEDRVAYLASGMDGFLVKPLDRGRLIEILSDIRARAAIAA